MMNFNLRILAICLTVLAILACNKDEPVTKMNNQDDFISSIKTYQHMSDEPYRLRINSRTGQKKPVFYLSSLTIQDIFSNELTQESVNKLSVDSVFCNQYDTEVINLSYVDYSFYDVMFRFTNGKEIKRQLMCPIVIGPSFKFKPIGLPLFTYAHTVVKIRKTPFKFSYFDLNFGLPKNKFEYIIGIDKDSSGVDRINGSHPSGSIFRLPHQ